jgi:tetrahydromethanopterin S-methyltransferase subunit C
MIKRAAHNVAIALLFAASTIPVLHGFSAHSTPASSKHVVVAISGGDPEPIEPGMTHTILAYLGLA